MGLSLDADDVWGENPHSLTIYTASLTKGEDGMKCKDCKYWKDYTDRVWARIPQINSYKCAYGLELRRCQYRPHPSVDFTPDVYVPEDYGCSEFVEDKL